MSDAASAAPSSSGASTSAADSFSADSFSAADSYDAVVIGAGPAGLSAALNLVRARRRVLVLDSSRPRNAATLASHGFITRDGISPLELRKLGREELEHYPEAEVQNAVVTSVSRDSSDVFVVAASGIRGTADRLVRASVVIIATGLAEALPAVTNLRAYYGTALHSCVECDGYEKTDAPLALIGETDDLAARALLLTQWSRDLIVFTNGVGVVSEADEALLGALGVRVERRTIAAIEGERAVMTGVRLADVPGEGAADGELIVRSGGFVRPVWTPSIGYLDGLAADGAELARDPEGLLVVDHEGRTSVPGLYAAGDVTPPGPQQLIVAAGAGARVAAAVNRDLLRESVRLKALDSRETVS